MSQINLSLMSLTHSFVCPLYSACDTIIKAFLYASENPSMNHDLNPSTPWRTHHDRIDRIPLRVDEPVIIELIESLYALANPS
jgi:hypothetical protein